MSKISFEDFSIEVAKDLEISSEQFATSRFSNIPEYDSMGKITVSLTIERLFGFQIEYEILDDVESLQSLYEFCFKQSES